MLQCRWMYNNRLSVNVSAANRVSSPKCLKIFGASEGAPGSKTLGSAKAFSSVVHCVLEVSWIPVNERRRMWWCDWFTSQCHMGSLDQTNLANLMSQKWNSTLRPSKKLSFMDFFMTNYCLLYDRLYSKCFKWNRAQLSLCLPFNFLFV